jgi:hypothetical protein
MASDTSCARCYGGIKGSRVDTQFAALLFALKLQRHLHVAALEVFGGQRANLLLDAVQPAGQAQAHVKPLAVDRACLPKVSSRPATVAGGPAKACHA